MIVSYIFNVIFLSCLILSVFIFSILFAIWFLLYFMAEEDKGIKNATIPKIIFVISLSLTIIGVFLMPYSLFSHKMEMGSTWYLVESIFYQVFYAVVLLFVVCVVPFSICYYESEDPYVKRSWVKQAICGLVFTGIIVVVFLGIFISTYFFLGKADIEYVSFVVDKKDSYHNLEAALQDSATECNSCKYQSTSMTVMTSFIIYMVAIVSLLGYSLFVIFGGCGMTALPVSCVCSCIKRKKGMDVSTYSRLRTQFREKSERLLEIGEKMDRKIEMGDFSSPRDRIVFNEYKQISNQLVKDWKHIQTAFKEGGDSVIKSFSQLIIGIGAGFISVIWVIHIILFIAIQPWFSFGFLNIVFTYVDYLTSFFPIIGATLYGIFTFHLILSVFSGTEEIFGTLPLIAIHPLVKKDTMMSSLLWNGEIFLLIGISISQFTSYAFGDYASSSVLNLIFGNGINNLRWFEYFYQYAVKYGFLAFTLIGFIYVLIKNLLPKKKNEEEKKLNRLTNGVGKSYYSFGIKKMFKKGEEKSLLKPLNE